VLVDQNDVARQILKKDRKHIPLAFLRHHDGQWEQFFVWSEDKRDKFVLWHQLGHLVGSQGYDAVIFTTEVWMAPSVQQVLYPDVEGMSGRREALVTYLETRDGTRVMWRSDIVRVLGRPYLKKAEFQNELDADKVMFFAPVRRAWANSDRTSEAQGRARRAPSVATRHDAGAAGENDQGPEVAR
jgi:hypothetical protein